MNAACNVVKLECVGEGNGGCTQELLLPGQHWIGGLEI